MRGEGLDSQLPVTVHDLVERELLPVRLLRRWKALPGPGPGPGPAQGLLGQAALPRLPHRGAYWLYRNYRTNRNGSRVNRSELTECCGGI